MIPPRPQIVLARLDSSTAELRWWLRCGAAMYEQIDTSTAGANMLRQRVSIQRLRLPGRMDWAVYVGDVQCVIEIRNANLKMERSDA